MISTKNIRKRIKVGVVGVRRGQVFARGVGSHLGMELVAICDTWEEKLLAVGKELKVPTYMDFEKFKTSNIQTETQNFDHPRYDQAYKNTAGDNFLSHMSVVDLLFNHGPQSLSIIRNKDKNP